MRRRQHLFYLFICITIYFLAVISYTVWSNIQERVANIEKIDQKLLLTAQSLKYILAPDFHDRAVDKDSIAPEEETRNRIAVSDFAAETEFQWLYTLVEKDGHFFFSAPTVTQEELKERESWYFYPYDDIPEGFVKAYKEKQPIFISYTDQWGDYRSVALPQISPGGRTYLACADYKISDINTILRKNLAHSVYTSIFFLLVSLPFIFFSHRTFSAYNARLKSANRELSEHKLHLEDLVAERTAELNLSNKKLRLEIAERKVVQEALELERDKLQEALEKVKTLSGMLPICAVCKKIRDDKGYWNQIEAYIRDRSEAEFSHSMCPDCLEKFYPGIKVNE